MSLKPPEVHRGALARPFQGWSVQILPVRSTVLAPGRNRMQDHSSDTSTEAVDSTLAMSFIGYPISVHKLMQNPRPIVFDIRVPAGMFSRWDCAGRMHGVRC